MPNSRPKLTSLFISLALIVCFVSAARAQSALDGFDPNANDAVTVIVVQPDGKIIIGGDFTSLAPNGGAPVTRNRIARLNVDGSLDTGFNPNANDSVRTIVLQADGKIVVGGFFTSIGGQPRSRIARLNAATGLADSFDPNANGIVRCIAVQTNGQILVGGQFTSIGGQARSRIARLDAATGAADSFNPNANSTVFAITVQTDGKILTGGVFNGVGSIGGQDRNRIARLDPATGLADSFNPNANGSINSIAVQADGKILAGGDFNGPSSIGGQARNRIARLDAATGLADSWISSANGSVQAIALQPDGKILVGGGFTVSGGHFRSHIARLDATTGVSDSFDPNTAAGSTVFAIAVQADGKILAGGSFIVLAPNGGSSVTRNYIARLENDGRADRTLDDLNPNSLGAITYATAVQPDGKILIGGILNFVLGVERNGIARLNTDGTLDTGFNPNATNGSVYSIAVQVDGKILVGGYFSNIGGQPRNNIARLDPTTGAADSFNPNANDSVYSIAVQADGKILAGGFFNTIGGQTRNGIARLDAVSGSADSWNPNANGIVHCIAVQTNGQILAGGQFTSIGGQARSRIARLDAATGAADSFNPNANSTVFAITVQTDGKILTGGVFNGVGSIGGQDRNRIARLDATTGLADSFNPNANGSINSIAVQADGKILAGGDFTSIGGQPRNRIARLDAATGLADSFNPNADESVYSIAVQADGKILAGGFFTSIGGQTREKFARLNNDTVATQNLTVTQTTVTWTRGGSSPHLTRVTFEDSSDGVNYNFLGNGTATGSNWTLTGLNLSIQQNLFIRARGFYRSGQYNGSESIQESVRNAFIVPPPTISGTITYGNVIGNPVPPRFVKNVSVASTVGSPAVGPVITGLPGTYTLTGFGTGAYTIKPTKPGGANGAITSNDAARVAQGVTGSLPFVSNNQRFAADVSGNGVISSTDAAKIAQFAAGLPFSPPNFTGEWRFFTSNLPAFPAGAHPQDRTYASVTSSVTGEDYIGILIGDTSGNWNPATHPRPVGGRQLAEGSEQEADGNEPPRQPKRLPPLLNQGGELLGVELPQVAVAAGKEIVVPVNVLGVVGKGIISYEFDLRYDPAVVQPLVEAVDVAGTVSRGLLVVVNPYEPGLLRVVVYGAMPIDGDGLLLNLRFTAVGVTGSVSLLTWERIMFNEGEPGVTTADGQIELF